MYKLYFKNKFGELLNEEPLISTDRPTLEEKFRLSLREDSVSMVVIDTERIFGCNDYVNGITYYITVKVNNDQMDFTASQKESIVRDIRELNEFNPIKK